MGDRIPFSPSNSDHGIWFMSQWCEKCDRERAYRKDERKPGCRIVAMTMCYSAADPEYPKEWREDGPEGPRCTAFTPEKIPSPRRSPVPRQDRNAASGDLFS